MRILAPKQFQSRMVSTVEVVDSYSLDRNTKLLTVRWGPKLILLAYGRERVACIAELDDSSEIDTFLTRLQERKDEISRTSSLFKVLRRRGRDFKTED